MRRKPFVRKAPINLWILVTFLALFVSSCTLPAPASPTPVNQEAVFTSAAETIIAQLTQSAPTYTAGEPAVQTPLATEPATPSPPTDPSPEPGSSPTPTVTVTETQSASDSPTPSPTSTPLPSDPRARFGDPDFSDTFVSSENWPLFEDDHVSFEVARNRLVMTAFKPDSWDSWMLSWPSLEDFYIEMTATQERCSGLDRYGMMLRATQSTRGYVGYLLGISCDGRYSLRRWDGNRFVTLVDWTPNDRLNAGSDQMNRFGMLAEGNRLGIYANGQLLEEISDNTHAEGRIGVFVGSVNTDNFTVQVEEVAFWELP
jgi:hypothetical protein